MAFLPKLVICASAFLACCDAVDDIGCGTTKMCVRNRDGCDLTDPTCLFFSYVWDPVEKNFFMEMSGGSGAGSQYYGLGFTYNEFMSDAEVYFCIGTELKAGSILGRHAAPVIDATFPDGITNDTAATTDGLAECTFRRKSTVTKVLSAGNYQLDLNFRNFYIIQALGSFSGGAPLKHSSSNRWQTATALNFTFTASDKTVPGEVDDQTASGEVDDQPVPEEVDDPSVDDFKPDPTAECNTNNKRCFKHPADCTPGSSSCMFVAWTFKSDSHTFDFEMVGGSGTERQYAAFALASAGQMQDADLYYCTESKVTSGVIKERHQKPTAFNNSDGLSNMATGTYNDVLRCSMTRNRSITKEISGGVNKIFDLLDSQYHVLYAVGQTDTVTTSSYLSASGQLAIARNDLCHPWKFNSTQSLQQDCFRICYGFSGEVFDTNLQPATSAGTNGAVYNNLVDEFLMKAKKIEEIINV